MSSQFFDRQPSERFAELLDEMGGSRRHHRRSEHDAELAPLVGLTRDLADRSVTGPDAEFRTGLRAMLMANIERDGIGATVETKSVEAAARAAMSGKTQVVRQVRPRSGRSGRTRAAVLTGVIVGAIALSGVSLASTDALPGDPLYQVKRSSEQAQLALAGSDASRGQLFLEFAYLRLIEAGQAPADAVAGLLADMQADALRGAKLRAAAAVAHGDVPTLDGLRAFVDQQRARLANLPAGLPADAQAARRDATALLLQIETRADELISAIASGCAFTRTDDLGPVPC